MTTVSPAEVVVDLARLLLVHRAAEALSLVDDTAVVVWDDRHLLDSWGSEIPPSCWLSALSFFHPAEAVELSDVWPLAEELHAQRIELDMDTDPEAMQSGIDWFEQQGRR